MTREDRNSFSSQVKEELVRLPLGKSCCQLSEIDALTQTSGHLTFRGRGRIAVQYRTENTGVARRLFQLLKTRASVSPTLHYTQTNKLGGRRTWVITLGEADSKTLLILLHMIDEDENGNFAMKRTMPRHPMTRQCCRRAFLRGAFLGAGTMSTPMKEYHLEFRTEDERQAQNLSKLMEKSGILCHTYSRKGQQVVYLKDAEQISNMLAWMGASGSVLHMESIRVKRQTRLRATRAANCDEHNSEKMLDAAIKQAEACRNIGLKQGLFTLSPALREMARMRIEHPELSLAELGEMMDPPLSKSAVNHRLRRLMEIAEGLD